MLHAVVIVSALVASTTVARSDDSTPATAPPGAHVALYVEPSLFLALTSDTTAMLGRLGFGARIDGFGADVRLGITSHVRGNISGPEGFSGTGGTGIKLGF